jgi:hypothetical protein
VTTSVRASRLQAPPSVVAVKSETTKRPPTRRARATRERRGGAGGPSIRGKSSTRRVRGL